MKAATGELQLTVITLIAIAAIIGFFWLMWPSIKGKIEGAWNDASDTTGTGNATQYGNSSFIIVSPFE